MKLANSIAAAFLSSHTRKERQKNTNNSFRGIIVEQ